MSEKVLTEEEAKALAIKEGIAAAREDFETQKRKQIPLIKRWAMDSSFRTANPQTGEQRIVEKDKVIVLTPDDPRWDHRHDEAYYKHHPEARPKTRI